MCERYTCLLEQAVDSSLISSSDTSQSVPSSGTTTAAPSSGSEQQRDGSLVCTCTRETFGCGIHPRGRDEWIASQRGSLASTFRALAEELDSTDRAPGCGEKSCAQLTLSGPDGSFSKTPRASEPTAPWLSTSSWRVDTPGETERLRPLSAARRGAICVPVGGSWPGFRMPTLKASDGAKGGPNQHGSKGDLSVPSSIFRLPILTATRYGSNVGGAAGRTGTVRHSLDALAGGSLSPQWAEWYQGFPVGWTELKRSETHKSRCKRRSRGDYSEGR
jgi:hypothetical protein